MAIVKVYHRRLVRMDKYGPSGPFVSAERWLRQLGTTQIGRWGGGTQGRRQIQEAMQQQDNHCRNPCT